MLTSQAQRNGVRVDLVISPGNSYESGGNSQNSRFQGEHRG